MVRHVVLFRWIEGTTEAQIGKVAAGLSEMSSEIASIRAYSHGRDLELGSDRFDYAIVADFDDLEGLAAYTRHPAHQEVLRVSADVKESLATVDFEVVERR